MLEAIPQSHPRRPWAATILSIVVPGLGQVYAGRPRRGIVLWLLTIAVSLLGFFLVVLLPSLAALTVFGLVAAGLRIAVAVDAWRVATAAKPSYWLRPYNRWYVYTTVLLLSLFVLQPAIRGTLTQTVADAYRLPSGSMAPTYEAGDYVLVSPIRRTLRRGDIVVYKTINGLFIKRVAGTPGDTIVMHDGHLAIDGKDVLEPYESHDDAVDPAVNDFDWQRSFLVPGVDRSKYRPSLHTWGPLVVPADEYFMLGDNRSNSLDSRYMGFVRRDSITARPFVIYFSWDSAHSVRWRRLGRTP